LSQSKSLIRLPGNDMVHQYICHANIDARRLCVALTTAGFHARRLSRNLPIADADHDDFQQIILIAILTRASRYDARLGRWPTFVSLLAHNAVADTARACRRRPSMEPFD